MDNTKQKFSILSKKFLSCYPVDLINWEEILHEISWEEQELLLNCTIKSSLNQKYPIKYSYQLNFLKSIIQTLEKTNEEVHDLVYEIFCTLQLNETTLTNSTIDNFTYKHYVISQEDIISLKESISFVSNGTTGLCSWEAAVALSDFLIQNPKITFKKSILELGSGTGLCGFTVAKCCRPEKIILSDGSLKVINLLKENLQKNFSNLKIKYNKNDFQLFDNNSQEIGILHLLWEEIAQKHIENIIAPNIILASDVIYDESILSTLCQTIKYLFSKSKTNCIMYLATTIRNENTLNKFLQLLENLEIIYETVEHNLSQSKLYWNTKTPIKIFCIKKKK